MTNSFRYDLLLLSFMEILCMHAYLQPLRLRFTKPLLSGLFFVFQYGLCVLTNSIFFSKLSYATAAIYFLFMLGFIFLGYRSRFKSAVYHMMLLLLSGHCLKQIFFNLPLLFSKEGIFANAALCSAFCWLLFAPCYLGTLLLVRKLVSDMDCSVLSWKDVLVMLLAVVPVLFISYLPLQVRMSLRDFYAKYLGVELIASVCGICLLLWLLRARCSMQEARELDQLRLAMENQYAQFMLKEQCSQEIRQNYHDMRNQLIALRTAGQEEVEACLERLDETIRRYEATYHTGDPVVDSLLFEKGQRCAEKRIQLLCMADGRLLSFMNAMDLCSFLGNLLDNAVEAAEKLEPEQRSIFLKLTEYKDYVLLRCENAYKGDLQADETGSIPSTKSGAAHGFGLRGIRRIVEKYGGSMTICTEDGRFVFSVLFPRKAQ